MMMMDFFLPVALSLFFILRVYNFEKLALSRHWPRKSLVLSGLPVTRHNNRPRHWWHRPPG